MIEFIIDNWMNSRFDNIEKQKTAIAFINRLNEISAGPFPEDNGLDFIYSSFDSWRSQAP